MTPFIFNYIKEQYELAEKIEFAVIMGESGTTKKRVEQGYTVTKEHCSCMFFSAMVIPCRHIFKFLSIKEDDLFLPNLVAERWTKAYYYQSHPALNNYEHIAAPQPISFKTIRVPEEINKFKKTATLTKDINNALCNMSNSEFEYFYHEVKNMRNRAIAARTPGSSTLQESTATPSNHLSLPENFAETLNQSMSQVTSQNATVVSTNEATKEFTYEYGNDLHQTSTLPRSQPSLQPKTLYESVVAAGTSQPVYSSKKNMSYITLPPTIVPVGRPKGTGKTVIGTKRKMSIKTPSGNSPQPPSKKVKFFDKSAVEQGVLIVQWFTNFPIELIGKKKVTNADIIQDPIIFNRLRHQKLNINYIKKYLDKKTFQYIESEVDRISRMQHTCTKCRKYLSGVQVMCHGCLDCYHAKCIGLTPNQASKIEYFCPCC